MKMQPSRKLFKMKLHKILLWKYGKCPWLECLILNKRTFQVIHTYSGSPYYMIISFLLLKNLSFTLLSVILVCFYRGTVINLSHLARIYAALVSLFSIMHVPIKK